MSGTRDAASADAAAVLAADAVDAAVLPEVLPGFAFAGGLALDGLTLVLFLVAGVFAVRLVVFSDFSAISSPS